MKITTFNPQIITKDAESVVQLFEALGFQRKHTKEDIGDLNVIGIRMKNADGFYLDISQSDRLPVDCIQAIRMNVDDFEEAYGILAAHGFNNFYGDCVVETPTSKSVVMLSPSGFVISLIQHIRK